MESSLKPPSDVQLKRREKDIFLIEIILVELALLTKLPENIKFSTNEEPIGLTIQVF